MAAASVKAIPDGQAGATPYLTVRNGSQAIEFYKKAFGAVEVMRLGEPGGRVGHAELKIGPATIFLSDEYPEMDVRAPQTLGGSPVAIHLYVEDVDSLVTRAAGAGATVVRPVADQFYGDRGGKLIDPFGHVWWIATHKEDVSLEEMKARAAKLFGTGS
jgi:PhnB protein